MKIYLDEILQQMENCPEGQNAYLNIKTGTIVSLQTEAIRMAKELLPEKEMPEGFEKREKEILPALEIHEHGDDYLKLPDQYEIHEYSIMRDFVEEVTDVNKRETLYRAISGINAFHKFNDKIRDLKLEKAWLTFRRLRYVRIAEEWCEGNGIEYTKKGE